MEIGQTVVLPLTIHGRNTRRTGKVVYIHPQHIFFTAEFKVGPVGQNVIKESYLINRSNSFAQRRLRAAYGTFQDKVGGMRND